MHNQIMWIPRLYMTLTVLLTIIGNTAAFAQDQDTSADEDGSSEQVEESDDAYRRRMELEDARSRDTTFTDSTYTQKAELEKIDKLPEESRDNIRDQLIDVIIENGEWEPSDVLEEYPYEPTAAAKSDSELLKQEQEAWDEQIGKYHEREAAAFGGHRGPVPGPGNPTGEEGGSGQEGDGGESGESGAGGSQGSDGDGSSGSGGSYQPNRNGSEDGVSTAGVSESALDFLRGRQAQQPGQQPGQQAGQQASQQAGQQAGQQQDQSAESQKQDDQAAQEIVDQTSEQNQADEQQESATEIELDSRGIIAIKDLDKLEGAVGGEVPEEEVPEEEDP